MEDFREQRLLEFITSSLFVKFDKSMFDLKFEICHNLNRKSTLIIYIYNEYTLLL